MWKAADWDKDQVLSKGEIHTSAAWEGDIREAQGDFAGLRVDLPGLLVEGEVFVTRGSGCLGRRWKGLM
jgi:hypothetical protein